MTKSRIGIDKERALAARSLLCMLLLLGLWALAAPIAPVAHAAPFEPVLTNTNPGSPGTSLTPRIQGSEGGIVISVVRTGATGGGPVGRALDPAAPITIYEEDPTCLDAGAVVAAGNVGELESPGIQIPSSVIDPGSITTFYATQGEAADPSDCSAGIKYRHVTAPPGPPALNSVSPVSPANDNLPRLIGSADPEATVSIYADPSCSGAPLATGTGLVFGAPGIQVPVADNSTTTFYANAGWAGLFSGCSSSSVSYQEVSPQELPKENQGGHAPPKEPPAPDPPGKPPVPKLRTLPAGVANNNTPLVTGSARDAARVEIFAEAGCKGAPMAKGSASEFSAGLSVQVIDNVTVTFYGVSVDGGGDRSPCSPDPVVYVEDSNRPLTKITMGPGIKTRKRTAVFRFLDAAGETPGTSFLCKLDRHKWKPCSAPFRAKRLGRKAHTFQVKAEDRAGNREQRPAKRRFKVIR